MDNAEYDSYYKNAEVKLYKTDDASIAVRVYGAGPALVLVHGFPVHGYTWRKVLPTLAEKFTCFVVDLPGLGDSVWTSNTDFTFTAQARRLAKLLGILSINECAIQVAERLDHRAGRTRAGVAFEQHDAGGRDVERQPHQRGEQDHGRERREVERTEDRKSVV